MSPIVLMPEQALPFLLPVVPPRFTPLTAAAQNRRLAQKLYADFFAWPILSRSTG